MAVPGTVRVPGEAAFSARPSVDGTAVQGHLDEAISGADVELLLQDAKAVGH